MDQRTQIRMVLSGLLTRLVEEVDQIKGDGADDLQAEEAHLTGKGSVHHGPKYT
jgi:hypothetical protein